MSIKPYAGRTNKRTFPEFNKELSHMDNALEYDEVICCRLLPRLLKEEALAVYESLDDNVQKKWKTLTDEMSKQLDIGDQVSVYRRQAHKQVI